MFTIREQESATVAWPGAFDEPVQAAIASDPAAPRLTRPPRDEREQDFAAEAELVGHRTAIHVHAS